MKGLTMKPDSYIYSSRDFGETIATIETAKPDRPCIHKNVTGTSNAANDKFSADRKHPVHIVDLPSRAVSVTIGGILPGDRTRKHRHTYETIAYILKGKGYSVVDGVRVDWEAGDALLVPRWTWHQHFNLSETEPAEFLGAENAPMLQNLGLALREEAEKW
jgi:quercetin dioxygenase-like cupin family protein